VLNVGQFKLPLCVFLAHLLLLVAGLMYTKGGARKHDKANVMKVEIIISTPRLTIKRRTSEKQLDDKPVVSGDAPPKLSSENTNAITDIDWTNKTLQAEQHFLLSQSDILFDRQPKPRYPMVSRKLGEEGTVLVKGCIEENGSIRNVEIINGSGYKRLDAEAIETVRRWTFSGSDQKSKKIISCYRIPIQFVLEG
jgi:TonB family protein